MLLAPTNLFTRQNCTLGDCAPVTTLQFGELTLGRSPRSPLPSASPLSPARNQLPPPRSRSVLPASCLCSVFLPPHRPVLHGLGPGLPQPRDGLAIQSTRLVLTETRLEPDGQHGRLDLGRDRGRKPALIPASRRVGWLWIQATWMPQVEDSADPARRQGQSQEFVRGGLRLIRLESLL